MKMIFLMLSVLALTGCASLDRAVAPTWGWYREGQTQQAYNMDQANCRNEAMPYASTNLLQAAMVIDNCMIGKGWVKREYPRK